MFNMKALFLRAMLALAMALGASGAIAGPTYHVTLDTSEWKGTTGYLDLGYNGPGDAGLAVARIGNFVGDFFDLPLTYDGADGDVDTGVTITNEGGFNFFDKAVVFGGLLSFDVVLDQLPADYGMVFSIALFNDDFSKYLGGDGNLLEISLLPGVPDAVSVAPSAPLDVTAVPEPADWALVVTGLLLIGFTRRAQQRR
ncbi:NF038129 family PEP-CTERM protein [Massilia sp. ST3]|uniref:NF038129 family PEP-CTERM protein n=1 Tax=Massilia sp. ST3 TaxID=2824903 RepID=UPI001B841700|nr:NF038129 family PEP-CTERM protein [Massilia sp. ST3]MBQ5949805.1 NF038129 family PEP-CTERM protein [Massilia sp. ST3]